MRFYRRNYLALIIKTPGSTHAKRFRSVPEFIPHALWLLTDLALDRSNCNCKYCNKKPQREITASMGLLPKRSDSTPTSSRSVAPPPRLKRPQPLKEKTVREREKTARENEKDRPFVGVRRAPKMVKPPAPKQSMLRERNSDLSCAYGPEVPVRRWFREGELLWCALNPPIEGPSGSGGDDSILFWPGIVEETRMKPIPILKDTVMDGPDGPSNVRFSANLSDGNEVPWIIEHVLSYKMKLLGVSHSFYVRDDQVLPYQSIVPPDELIQAIHDVPIEEIQRDPAHTSTFNPYSMSGEKISFTSAAASYGIALQVGANIAGYWAPTDDWEFKFTVEHPNAGIPPPPKPSSTFQSLDSVMNSSMTYNANLSMSLATPSGSGGNTPNIPGQLTSSLPLGQPIVQTRYQGLWWGAERIWTDELIRLKFSRAQVAPQGNDLIYAPARPSRKAREYAQLMGGEVGGAETRGVFMRLEGLYVADPPDRKGNKVCLAVGMLYELVDEDWDEEDGQQWESSEVVIGKGKGKASGNGSASDGTPVVDGVTAGPSFMDSTSPLANPDPAVPVESTTTDVLSHSNIPGSSTSVAPKHSANGALSHPVLSSPFPLPEAPEGFKFRSILKPGTEIIVDLTWIAGRYYPGLLKHRLLDRHVERALASGGVQLWALEGLTPGYFNAMDPTRWKALRTTMVREADREARAGLEEHWENKEKERRDAELLEKSFLPPSGLDGVGVFRLDQKPVIAGTSGQAPKDDVQGVQDGENGGLEWRAFANGMLEDTAMSVD
jgi:hypothetical protein